MDGSSCCEVDPRNCGRFVNESFRQRLVRQRLRSIRQRLKSLCERPTGQFANVRYPILTKIKLLIDVWNVILILGWSLGQEILSHRQFRLTDFRSICMFLIVPQAGPWAQHCGNFHGENWLLNTKVRWLPKVLQLPYQFADNALRCKLTLYLCLFQKQTYNRVRNVIESEIKWNVK